MKHLYKYQLQARYILCIFLLNTTFIALANNQENDFRRIQIGVNFSPDFCYRTLSGDDYNIRSEREEARFGYTGGFIVSFNHNQKCGIESGIQYSNKGFRTQKEYPQIDCSDPPCSFNNEWHRFVYNFHYIEIPLKARITIGQQKVRFLMGLGLTPSFLAKATNTIQHYDGKKDISSNYTGDYNRFNLFATISVGVDYKITPKSSIRVEPVFQYGIWNLTKVKEESNLISEYLWSAGVNLSYLIGIK